jgi:hypothetical protein
MALPGDSIYEKGIANMVLKPSYQRRLPQETGRQKAWNYTGNRRG